MNQVERFAKRFREAKTVLDACEVYPGGDINLLWSDDDGKTDRVWTICKKMGKHRCGKTDLQLTLVAQQKKTMQVCFLDTRRVYIPDDNVIITWWPSYPEDCDENEPVNRKKQRQEDDDNDEDGESEEEEGEEETEFFTCAQCSKHLHEDSFSDLMKKQQLKKRKCLRCTTRQKDAVVTPPAPREIALRDLEEIGSYEEDSWLDKDSSSSESEEEEEEAS